MARQEGCGVAVHMAEHGGRVLKLDQQVSAQQKAMSSLSSAATMTDTASQSKLQWEDSARLQGVP